LDLFMMLFYSRMHYYCSHLMSLGAEVMTPHREYLEMHR
jgi:hypothetical protein